MSSRVGTQIVPASGRPRNPFRGSLRSPAALAETTRRVEYRDDLAPELKPIAIGWVADLVDELEAALRSRTPSDRERSVLLTTLPQLSDGIVDWVGLLESQASGGDATDSVWLAVRKLLDNLPAKLESPWDPEPAGVFPTVAPNSVAGRVLVSRQSRAMESDPFRDAASALSDADAAGVVALAGVSRDNADRAIRSIDACLRLLAGEAV